MKIKNKLAVAVTALVAGLASLQQAGAATVTANLGTLSGTVTTSGTFVTQDVVFEALFSLTTASDLTLHTTSYAGGGFEPQITLYTGAGNYVASESVTSPLAKVDSSTGLALDSYLFDANLAPGSYIAVVTDFLNQQPAGATNLSDGFVDIGGPTGFVDEQGNTRNGSYSLTLSTSSAPEPATLWLSVPLLAVGLARFRKRRA